MVPRGAAGAFLPSVGDWVKARDGVGLVVKFDGRRVTIRRPHGATCEATFDGVVCASAAEVKLAKAECHLAKLKVEAERNDVVIEDLEREAVCKDDEARTATEIAAVATEAAEAVHGRVREAREAAAALERAIREAQEAVDVADAERSAAQEAAVEGQSDTFEADLATLGLEWDNAARTRLVARTAPLNGDVQHRLLDARGFDLMEVRLPKEGGRLLRFERSEMGQRQLFYTVEPPTDPPTLPEHFQSWHSPVRHAPLVGNSAQRGAAQHEEVSLLSDDEEAGAPNKKRRVVPPEESSDDDDDIPQRPRAGVPEELSDEDVCVKLRTTGGLSGSRGDAAAYAAGQRAATGQANQAIKRRALPY